MKNGFYLSAYVHIDELAHLEKIQVRHDQNIALWYLNGKEVELVHYWELERLTGIKKHNCSFYNCEHFSQILNQLLAEYNITMDDLVEIWGVHQYACSRMPLGKVRGFSYHTVAHAYSVLLSNMDTFRNNNILVLAVDGGPDNLFDEEGDNPFCACYTCHGEFVEWVAVASPAPLWSYAKNTFYLEEGSLMALMSACNCSWSDFPLPFLEINSLRTVYEAIKNLEQIKEMIWSIQFNREEKVNYSFDERFSIKENKISMFMKIIFQISNKMMENNLNMLIKKFGIDTNNTYLAIVGGYALNCPSNSYLLDRFHFKMLYEIPCVNDTGLSLGYGLGEFYARKTDINFKLKSAFYGNKIEYDERAHMVDEYIESISKASAELFAKDISKEVIIWVEDRCEIGPRALGHRSILADPRNEKVKNILNEIKGRQWWRPVAPIILEDNVSEWFEKGTISDYMLKTFTAIPKVEKSIEAVLHLDKSARVQTINRKQGFLYDCIYAFYILTGIPIICNTSLNDKGEPMIDTFYGVLLFAIKKDIHIIYINHMRVVLNKDRQRVPLGKVRVVDFEKYTYKLPKSEISKRLNPYNASNKALALYYNNRKIRNKINLSVKKDVKILEKLASLEANYQMEGL